MQTEIFLNEIGGNALPHILGFFDKVLLVHGILDHLFYCYWNVAELAPLYDLKKIKGKKHGVNFGTAIYSDKDGVPLLPLTFTRFTISNFIFQWFLKSING